MEVADWSGATAGLDDAVAVSYWSDSWRDREADQARGTRSGCMTRYDRVKTVSKPFSLEPLGVSFDAKSGIPCKLLKKH